MVPPIPHFFRDGVEYKICKGCSKELELVCFGKYSRAHDGLKAKCRACLSQKPFTEANPNSPTKICARCVVRKEKSEFRGNRGHCKTCEKAQGRAYRHTHKEKAKAWTEANRERMSELQHQWYIKHRAEIRKTESWRMYNDPHFRRIKYYRMSINGMFRGTHLRNKYLKCSRTEPPEADGLKPVEVGRVSFLGRNEERQLRRNVGRRPRDPNCDSENLA